MLPNPNTAVPLEITATRFLAVLVHIFLVGVDFRIRLGNWESRRGRGRVGR